MSTGQNLAVERLETLYSHSTATEQVTWCRPHSSAGHLFTRPKAGEAHTPTLPAHSSGATQRRWYLERRRRRPDREARALMGEDDSGRTQSSLPPQRLPASSCGGPVRQAFFSVRRRNIQRKSACPLWSRIELESLSLTLGISRQPHPLLPESPSPFQHIHCHSAPL